MIRSVLEQIGGVGVYGIISMLLFMGVFTGVLLWILRLRPAHIDEMKNLPLTNDRSNAGDLS